jgi:hypothetical protein
MAQTTRSSRSRSSPRRSSSSRSTSRNGSSSRSKSTSSRARSTSGRNSRSGTKSRSSSARSSSSRARSTSKARASSSNGAIGKAGGKVAELASKAKTPLMAGGAALAGIAGGVALKSRNDSRRPLKSLRSVSLPKSVKNIDLGKLDLNTITSAARRVQSIGEQVGDVADAADKTRKKHK